MVIRVGGVPEHFNYLFKLAEIKGLYKKHNVNVKFINQFCGTGEMINSIKTNKLDVIIALTEGLITDIAKGSDLKLLGTYVNSPLCWAVSVGRNSIIKSKKQLKGEKIGISRYGSGSHLMSYVMVNNLNWASDSINFKEIGNFENLRNSVNNNTVSAFLWEKFTTKPYHDSFELKKIGEVITPWPSFLIATLKINNDQKREEIKNMMKAIKEASIIFKTDTSIPSIISDEYKLNIKDAQEWYENVEIIAENKLSREIFNITLNTLKNAKVLNELQINLKIEDAIDSLICEIVK